MQDLKNWIAPAAPSAEVLEGQYVRLERLEADRHAALLFRAFDGHDHSWEYMFNGPFASASLLHRWVRDVEGKSDPYFYAIKDLATGHYAGVASFMRIDVASGCIEVGSISYAPELQRTRAATEAMYLMMKWAFEAGYRRYEWKCHAGNIPSRRAAQRLGFSYEGIFRQHMVVKGRNRDTAWFAITDKEWPALDEAFRFWLSPANFDSEGRQRESLGNMTALVRVASDPLL